MCVAITSGGGLASWSGHQWFFCWLNAIISGSDNERWWPQHLNPDSFYCVFILCERLLLINCKTWQNKNNVATSKCCHAYYIINTSPCFSTANTHPHYSQILIVAHGAGGVGATTTINLIYIIRISYHMPGWRHNRPLRAITLAVWQMNSNNS